MQTPTRLHSARLELRMQTGWVCTPDAGGFFTRMRQSAGLEASVISAKPSLSYLPNVGRALFSFAIAALGVETLLCARYAADSLGPQYRVIPVLPWLPPVPGIAIAFGAVLVICGAGLLSRHSARLAQLILGTLLFLSALILDLPKYLAHLGNMSLRTTLFEPLSLATLAWLLPVADPLPRWITRGSRYLLGLALIVFGVDHLIGLVFIATLIPAWIPWHMFWIGFFGIGFIAAGLSIGLNVLEVWGAYGIGLMFAIWVVTLHLPRVMGRYGIPGAPHNPNEWQSLLIAVALWGGPWALAGAVEASKRPS